jgi:dTDP-4-amino-4,6-dideoxygalactose transaminase
MTIPFVDLRIHSASLRREVLGAIEKAVDDCQFILGDAVRSFEEAFAKYCGAEQCVGVANGTDALHLTLRALGIGPGDEVITAANSFIASALAIAYTGASPVFVDVDPTDYTIDVDLLERAITRRTKAILPVHLYGQPADMPAICRVAERHGLPVVQDACQAHGARIDQRGLGAFGAAACYSFYPSKNLGAFGDGGAIVTNDDVLATRVRMLRNYGQQSKNNYSMLGYNSRLDTLQAAVLAVKLRYLELGNHKRRMVAARYQELLNGWEAILPTQRAGTTHVYHLYVVQHCERDAVLAHLQNAAVQCGIHYPAPIHQIESFRSARTVPEGAPVSSRLANRILSLPVFPELSEEQIDTVARTAMSFTAQRAVA